MTYAGETTGRLVPATILLLLMTFGLASAAFAADPAFDAGSPKVLIKVRQPSERLQPGSTGKSDLDTAISRLGGRIQRTPFQEYIAKMESNPPPGYAGMSGLLKQQARYDEGRFLVALPSGTPAHRTARTLAQDPQIEYARRAFPKTAQFIVSGTLPDHVPGHVIVKFREDTPGSVFHGFKGGSRLELLLRDLGLEAMEPLLAPSEPEPRAEAALSAERRERRKRFQEGLRRRGLFRYYVLTFSPSFEMKAVADLLAQQPEVESTGLDNIATLPEPPRLASALVLTDNDEYFESQWNLQNVTRGGIDVLRAWEISRGYNSTSSVIIAVIDTGIDLGHNDIDDKIVDATSVLPDDPDAQDKNGHGTAVAGVAAAETDNGLAMAGVCPGCLVMPIKITNQRSITSVNVARGLQYAIDHHADIINMSFFIDDIGRDPAAEEIIETIVEDASVPLVAGVGNSGVRTQNYPASFPNVIAVGGTDEYNNRWDSSDWGAHLDLMAPSVNVPSIWVGEDFHNFGGTSAATPHVSGVIGLLLGKRRSLHPKQIQTILEWTADPSVCPNIGSMPSNPELFIGKGRIQAFHALTAVAFEDVDYHDWFLKYVMYARQEGVIEGFSDDNGQTFHPRSPATRAEVLKMAYEAAAEEVNPSAPNPGFADVHPSDWFYSYVSDARHKGYIEGRSCGSALCFYPNENVIRAEAVKIISELFKVSQTGFESVINVPASRRISFPDVPAGEWFYPYVHWMANSEISEPRLPNGIESPERLIQGYPDGLFRPGSLVNRAEMAKIIVNTMLYLGTAPTPTNCNTSTLTAGANSTKAASGATSIGFLYEQVIDPGNPTAPTPLELPGGNEQTVTSPISMMGDSVDADGHTLFYFWSADGGSFTTSDPVSYSRVTWSPPAVAEDTVFRIQVVRGDHRGLVGRSTFRFLVPGTSSNNPGSGTITSPNGTQTGLVTVSASASDPDGLARVSVRFISGGSELVLCGPDGPASCSGTSGNWSRTGVNPGAYGASSGTVTLTLSVQDILGDVRSVDTHAFSYNPPIGPTFKLTIRKEGDGKGTISGSSVVCGPSCTSTSVNLAQGSSVTLTGSAATGSVFVGFMGNRCYGTAPCTLTIESDLTIYTAFGLPDAFAIRFTAPSNGDTGVATSAQVNVTFNRDIAEGPNYTGLALRESGGTPVPFTPVIRSTDRRLVLIPSSNLVSGKSYVVSIPAGAISDTQGNPLAVPHSFTFTTAAAGAPKMYISAYPPHVMEGSTTKVSIWFETPSAQERTITLTSTPAGELIHPGEVILEAGKTLVELQVDSRYNHGSTSPATATLSAATAGVGQQSVQIVVANNTAVTGPSLVWQAASVVDDTDQDGIFEAGEIAEIMFEVANIGSASISNVILEFSVINAYGINILGGAPYTCYLGSLARGRGANCTKRFRADEGLPTGDYYIQVKGTSGGNSILDQARIEIVNNLQPDFILNAGSFPTAELQPGSTVNMTYTARNDTDGFSERLPVIEVTLEMEGTQRLLYRLHANARGYIWNDQTFRLPLVVPPVPGTHIIRARINPPAGDRIPESNYANNDATVILLRVAGPNQPPVLNPIPGPLSAQVGRALSLTVSASDPNNDSITYSLGAGSPTGATINSTSGVFTWTPTCAQGPMSYPISIIARDSKGATDTETFAIQVGIEADLGLAQIANPESAVPGQIVGLTLVVTNQGPSCMNGATLAAPFPASLTDVSWTCAASSGSSCAVGGTGSIGDSSVSLGAEGTATYTVTARVADTASGLVISSATVTAPAGTTDPNGTNNGASATFTLRGLDFGDAPGVDQGAPWTFPTQLAENGARHGVVPEIRLGATLDAELDGQPSLAASGDDVSGARDEDGVVVPAEFGPCQTANLQVTASAPGFLNAWVDFNTDGDWLDAGERVLLDQALSTGINPVAFVVPCSATPGGTAFARFRYSSAGNLGTSGLALDGEVEDYSVKIAQVLHRMTVSLTGTGIGTVTASPGGIDCGAVCFADYAFGTIVTLAATPAAGSVFTGWSGGGCSGTGLCSVNMSTARSVTATFLPSGPQGLDFYSVTPCRILDTRSSLALSSMVPRSFPVAELCNVPLTARAVVLNVTVASPTGNGYISLWPADLARPLTSVVNFAAGTTRANNAVVVLATNGGGDIAAQAFVVGSGTVHLVLDVSGYFE
jgi:uncharacterized repeat protein (TIGR01451 family)